MKNDYSVYIANPEKYNKGKLVGEWFTFPINEDEVAEKVGLNERYEEYAIYDYEFPVRINEYISIKELNEMNSMIEDMDDHIIEALSELISCYGDLKTVYEHCSDIIFWRHKDMEAIAEELVEMGYYGEVPHKLKYYIDYLEITCDLKTKGRWIKVSDGILEVHCKGRKERNMKGCYSVYLADIEKYKNGEIVGEWFTFPINEDEVVEKLSLNKCCKEYAVIGSKFPMKLKEYSEYISVSKLNEMHSMIEDMEDYVIEALDKLISFYGSLRSVYENSEYFVFWQCDSMEEVAMQIVEKGHFGEVPKKFMKYIDYSAVVRYLEDNCTWIKVSNGILQA